MALQIGPLWGEVLQYLSYSEVLESIRLVCVFLKTITEGPEFWGRIRRFCFNGEEIKSKRLIEKIFRNMPAVESIRLIANSDEQAQLLLKNAFLWDQEDEYGERMSKRRRRLKSLDLSKVSFWIDDSIVQRIAQSSPELMKVNFSNSEDANFTEIFTMCSKLQSLTLANCKLMDLDAMNAIAENLKNLEELNLESCERITDQGMIEITMNCINLKKAVISFCRKLTNISVRALLEMPKMEYIEARYCHISDSLFDISTDLDPLISKSLKYLDLKACSAITDDSCRSIGLCFPNLKELDFSLCPLISYTGLDELMRSSMISQSSIEIVHITGCRVTNDEHELLQLLYPLTDFILEKNQKLRLVLDLLCRGWSMFRSQNFQ